MTTLNSICDALAAQIIDNLDDDINVYPRPIDDPRFPYVMLMPGSPFTDYHHSMGPSALGQIRLKVKIGASGRTPDAVHQVYDLMDVGVGTTSVPDAIEYRSATDQTPSIGGLVSCVYCDIGNVTTDETDTYGELNVLIMAARAT